MDALRMLDAPEDAAPAIGSLSAAQAVKVTKKRPAKRPPTGACLVLPTALEGRGAPLSLQ